MPHVPAQLKEYQIKEWQGNFSLPWQYILGHLKDAKDNGV